MIPIQEPSADDGVHFDSSSIKFRRSSQDVLSEECEPDYLRTREQLLQELKEDVLQEHPEKERADALAYIADIVRTHSEELVQRWNKEIDSLLTYAGLFSAVLTAFNVESYQLLKPDPTDQSTAILLQISAQLGSLSIAPPFINSTRPSYDNPSTSNSGIPRYAVWLNALWFASLICSLASASVGIMVKQWISEYSSGLAGHSPEIEGLRQYRFNNLQKWHVPEIVALLPLLLQTALFLFLIGLLILLWSLDTTVAIVAFILIGTLLAFTLLTVILPSFRDDCCYLSPQSVAFFHLREWTRWSCRELGILTIRMLRPVLSWCYDLYRLFDDPDHHPVALWIYSRFTRMLWKIGDWEDAPRAGLPPLRSWWEHVLVVQRSAHVRAAMMATAFKITMDPRSLQITAPLLFELPGEEVLGYHQAVREVLKGHWGSEQSWPTSTMISYLAYSTSLVESALMADMDTTSDPCTNIIKRIRSLNGPPRVREQANLKALTRVAAITSMSSPDMPVYVGGGMSSLARCLQYSCEPESSPISFNFTAVASAITFGLDVFQRLHHYESGWELEISGVYTDSLQAAMMCVAREITDSSSSDILVARACARRALSSLHRVLQLPVRKRILYRVDCQDIVEGLGRFPNYAHCRNLVTSSLLDDLEGLVHEIDYSGTGAIASLINTLRTKLALA